MTDAEVLDRIEDLENVQEKQRKRLADIEERLNDLENKGQLGYVDFPGGQG